MVFSLFWRKAWDNLGHVVILNMLWLTLAIPTGLAIYSVWVTVVTTSQAPAVAQAGVSPDEAAALSPGAPQPGAPAPTADEKPPIRFRWTPAAIPAVMFLALSWVLLCVATGFVYFATADFVANYDFSGYREVLRKYLKRGPILRSVGLITLFIVTLVAAVANVLFYLNLASRFGVVLFILAGVMLWFACFVVMTFVLAMPLVAQRDLTVWQAIRSGAVMALARPMRTLVVAVTASVIFVLGLMSGAGAGFFAVSAPTALFNAAAKVSLDEAEGRTPGEPELPVGIGDETDEEPSGSQENPRTE